MPYQKSPNYSTYETKRFGFNYDIEARDSTTATSTYLIDAYVENAIVEHIEKDQANPEVVIRNRPGATKITTSSGTGRGCYYWTPNGVAIDMFYVVGLNLYSTSHGTTPIGTLWSGGNTGPVGWTEFLYDNGNRALILTDGWKIYIVDSSYTMTTMVPFPNGPFGAYPFIPNPIFLDGYLFIAKGIYSVGGSADIYNSTLNDPTTGYSTFITAEMYPDALVGLAKNDNYIYAIGTNSIEFFYDAGLTNTSPLQRYASAVLQFGTPMYASNTIVKTDTEVFLVGDTGDGDLSVWKIDGFKPEQISTPAINRLITKLYQTCINASLTITAFELKLNGKKLYIINFPNYYSLVYDTDVKLWYKWTTNSSSGYTPTNYLGTFGSSDSSGFPYIQDTSGYLYKLDITYTSDGIYSFTTNLTTVKFDFDTFNNKTMSRIALLGGESGTTYNTYSISYSDNDYKTWSTPRTTNFSTDFPVLNQWGRFRRRAFRVSVNNTQPWMLSQAEIEINKGSQ